MAISRALRLILSLALIVALAAPAPAADDPCAERAGRCTEEPLVVIVSAFPAEQRLLLERLAEHETLRSGDRLVHVGTLAGTRVALVLSGIGLANAARTTARMLERFDVQAVLFSGVAGSDSNIADVVVPFTWTDADGTVGVDPALVEIAQALPSSALPFVSCTAVPPAPPGPDVCLGRTPQLVVGGEGQSEDPFGGQPPTCSGDDPIFGCGPLRTPGVTHGAALLTPLYPTAIDMETAAVAHVAARAGVPFLGFRGVSDGPGDPLDLGGFPAQFFAYYAIAADNAAIATIAFLEAWAPHAGLAAAGGTKRPRAACGWARAAGPACRAAATPAAVTRGVDKACRLEADAAAALETPRGAALADRAARRWSAIAKRLRKPSVRGLDAGCRSALATLLSTRAASVSP